MAPISNMEVLSGLGILASVLVGTGAIAFFVHYGTRMTLVETAIATAQIGTMPTRVGRLEDAMVEMKLGMSKLNSLEVILVKLDGIIESMKAMVPRAEHEVRWRADEARISALDHALNHPSTTTTRNTQ